jgi:hypothetical protein
MELHIAGLVSRLILFPMLLLICNSLFMCKSLVRRWGAALLILALMNYIHSLSITLKIVSFSNWNYFYSFLLFISFMVVAYGPEKNSNYFQKRETDMKIITYDDRFNLNEWIIILILMVGMAVMLFLPRLFPIKKAAVYYLYGVFFGLLMDHLISINPIDYYDVNDNSS